MCAHRRDTGERGEVVDRRQGIGRVEVVLTAMVVSGIGRAIAIVVPAVIDDAVQRLFGAGACGGV